MILRKVRALTFGGKEAISGLKSALLLVTLPAYLASTSTVDDDIILMHVYLYIYMSYELARALCLSFPDLDFLLYVVRESYFLMLLLLLLLHLNLNPILFLGSCGYNFIYSNIKILRLHLQCLLVLKIQSITLCYTAMRSCRKQTVWHEQERESERESPSPPHTTLGNLGDASTGRGRGRGKMLLTLSLPLSLGCIAARPACPE